MNKDNYEDKCKDEGINYRMEGFDKVSKSEEKPEAYCKSGRLPYGFKRYRTCPKCSKIIEIESIDSKQAVYYCSHCKKTIRMRVNPEEPTLG